jgi:hypothetical protein
MEIMFLLQVYNVVPSISAVTGISPGRYLWRMVIAFHLGPRLLIVSTYYHFLLSFVDHCQRADRAAANGANPTAGQLVRLLKAVYYLQVMEIVGLCGISFIHNREHYRKETAFVVTMESNMLSLHSHPPEGLHPVPLLFALHVPADAEDLPRDLAAPQPGAEGLLLQEARGLPLLLLLPLPHGLLLLPPHRAL